MFRESAESSTQVQKLAEVSELGRVRAVDAGGEGNLQLAAGVRLAIAARGLLAAARVKTEARSSTFKVDIVRQVPVREGNKCLAQLQGLPHLHDGACVLATLLKMYSPTPPLPVEFAYKHR